MGDTHKLRSEGQRFSQHPQDSSRAGGAARSAPGVAAHYPHVCRVYQKARSWPGTSRGHSRRAAGGASGGALFLWAPNNHRAFFLPVSSPCHRSFFCGFRAGCLTSRSQSRPQSRLTAASPSFLSPPRMASPAKTAAALQDHLSRLLLLPGRLAAPPSAPTLAQRLRLVAGPVALTPQQWQAVHEQSLCRWASKYLRQSGGRGSTLAPESRAGASAPQGRLAGRLLHLPAAVPRRAAGAAELQPRVPQPVHQRVRARHGRAVLPALPLPGVPEEAHRGRRAVGGQAGRGGPWAAWPCRSRRVTENSLPAPC